MTDDEEPATALVKEGERLGFARCDGRLIVLALFDRDEDGTLLPLELRVLQGDRLPDEDELAEQVRAWTPPAGRPFAFTDARALPLGSLLPEAQRLWDLSTGEQRLEPLSPAEIDELAGGSERLGFRSVRDMRSALLQALATAAYAQALAEADHYPTRAVAEATGTDERRASQLVMQARRSGLLSKAPQFGRMGGTATRRAFDLIDSARDALQRARAADHESPTTDDQGERK